MDKTRITNEYVISQFSKAIAVMEVKNANRFRIRAYQNAINIIKLQDEELVSIFNRGALSAIPGIGEELAAKITDLIKKGHTPEWDIMFKSVPQGMFSLLDIPGIGPKRAHQLANSFNLNDEITALSRVKNAAQNGEIKDLEGFGEKLEQDILSNIDREKPKTNRLRLDEGDSLAAKVVSILESIHEVDAVSILGSLRRREETIGDVDIAVATKYPDKVLAELKINKQIIRVQASGNNIIRLLLVGNKQADIKFQTPDKWGATLQHFTGSKFHNIALREFALKSHKSLSEHGVKVNQKLVNFSSEQLFYSYLGLDFIPPELRQNTGEIEAASNHLLPKLVKHTDIKGDFHTHTSYGWISSHDYGSELESLFDTAYDLGYEWLAIGDHNPSQSSYSEAEILSQIKERHRYIQNHLQIWQQTTGKSLHIFDTLEIDILPDGRLPLSDEALNILDFAIVSLHSRQNLPIIEQTDRVIKALNHPKVKIFGHPTGRLINQRHGTEIDWEKLNTFCLENNKALEINAQPVRLDLPDSLARQAIKNGIKLTIGTDAHAVSDMKLMSYGVDVARRSWATKSDIINTRSYAQIKTWLD